MKKYFEPEIEVVEFEIEDIITSGTGDGNATEGSTTADNTGT